jgi:hypothetical protein
MGCLNACHDKAKTSLTKFAGHCKKRSDAAVQLRRVQARSCAIAQVWMATLHSP